MKYKYVCRVFLCMLAFFAIMSCKSAPPVDEGPGETRPVEETRPPVQVTPTVPVGPSQVDLDALEAAAARAAAARKVAIDFEGPSLFPSEWDAAEALHAEAEQQRRTSTKDEVQESTGRYARAADAFEALADKTLAAAFEYAEIELAAAREAAVAAGAEAFAPDLLLDADNKAEDAQDKYQENDFYAALAAAEEALLKYNQALIAALESGVARTRAEAAAERQRALDLKANVAARNEYNSAEAVFNRANAAFQGQRYEEAINLYEECQPMFRLSAQMAQLRQQEAEEAMRRANQRVAESDETARSAEAVLGGGLE